MASKMTMITSELSIEDVLGERGCELPERALLRRRKHHIVNTIHPIIYHGGSNSNSTVQVNFGGGSNSNSTTQTNFGGGSNSNSTVQVNFGGGSNSNSTTQTNF
jgi:hypothetical protein